MQTKWQPPPQWPTKIYQAYEDFALETGISKRRLAQVLGIDSGEFNKCHLERLDKHKYLYNLHGRLLEHSTITSVAAELGLDRKGYHALKRLKAHIFSINSGYSMDADRLVLSTQDVLDSGMVGVELRDQGYWEPALDHLNYAWSNLKKEKPEPGSTAYLVKLRVGTQLASMLAFLPEITGALDIARYLEGFVRQSAYRGDNREILSALSLLYKGVGPILRHAKWHPQYVVQRMEHSHQIAQENGLNPLTSIAVLRDQAKPFVRWGLRADEHHPQDHFQNALDVLEQSASLAGRLSDEETCVEWLLTRLTQVECLAAMGQADAARRVWEEVYKQEWVSALVKKRFASMLGVKLRFAEQWLQLSQGKLTEVAAMAKAFRRDYARTHFTGHLQLASTVEHLADQGRTKELVERLLI